LHSVLATTQIRDKSWTAGDSVYYLWLSLQEAKMFHMLYLASCWRLLRFSEGDISFLFGYSWLCPTLDDSFV